MYVELKNINKTYGDYKASDNVSFGIEKGKLIGLLGPSGSGKTTILRMIAGLEQPDSGEIIIDGRVVNDVPASERGIGFVFQNYALFRYMTVYDNIAFGLKVQKADKKYIKQRVMELVELIGLKGLEKRYPSQLSGGQRQRVAFARALAPNPQLLLLDEPFAAIDAKIRTELRSWLKDMIEKLGITSIFVTHDQDEAIEVADEIIITNRGRIEQKGTPLEVYQNPDTAFTAGITNQSSTIAVLCSSTASFPFVTKILCTNTSTTSPSRTGSSSRLLLALSVVFPTRTFSSRLLPRNATRSTTPSVAELLYFCSSFFLVTFTNSGRTMAFSPPGTSSK